ncbi:hypothetical protein PIB30_005471 [Stylosanthes scabra]|uniref:Ribosome biogenesis protein NOP53 n=1 Tax=Stylosanthes scabra TaxID=79078 RepID=A0ABU6Z360_9FABA|nr:hypothetical protein [Stylosanthes scabra]
MERLKPSEKINRKQKGANIATLHDSKDQLPKLAKPETAGRVHLADLEPPAVDMLEIDPNFSNHKLSILPGNKPVAQKLRRMNPKKASEVRKQVQNLPKAHG